MGILILLSVVNLALLIIGIWVMLRVLRIKDNRFTSLNNEVFKLWKDIGRKSLAYGDYIEEKRIVTNTLFGSKDRSRLFVLELIVTENQKQVLKPEEWLALHQTLDTNSKVLVSIECSSADNLNSELHDIQSNLEAISNFGVPIYLVINNAAHGFAYSLSRYSRKIYATPGSEIDIYGVRDASEAGAGKLMSDAVFAGDHLDTASSSKLQRVKGDGLLDLGLIDKFGSVNEIIRDSIGQCSIYTLRPNKD